MKKIITHINPDLDAVASVWLIKRFLLGWEEVEIDFVQATASGEKIPQVDTHPEVLYVDVGRGQLDHHQTGEYLSAAKLCWEYVKKNGQGKKLGGLEEKAIEILVKVVTQVDNAHDLNWKEVSKNRYQLYFHCLIEGLRGLGKTDKVVMVFGLEALDAVLLNLKNKIRAEEELKEGREFQTPWGRGIALASGNRHVLWQGEAQGYVVILKKDPKTGGVQIYSRPDTEVDLTKAYNKVKKLDPASDWFLHASKKLLLNQASVNLDMRPTKLSLETLIKVLRL